jgi:hypothetical protein
MLMRKRRLRCRGATASAATVRKGDVYETLLDTGQTVGLTAQEVRDFVKKALREFGFTQARSIPRLPTRGQVTTIVGIIEAWNVIQEHSEPHRASKTGTPFESAEVVNHSSSGFLLRFELDTPLLRTGALLALRTTPAEPWSLGVIRWLQDCEHEVLTGVEVLSNFPQAMISNDQDRNTQTPTIVCEHEEQRIIYLPLGYADPLNVAQLGVNREIWVLSAAQELGDDWEQRLVLDIVT